jgi:hypothetical protein
MHPSLRTATAAILAVLAIPTWILLSAPEAAACAACGCGDPSVSELGIPDTDARGVVSGFSASVARETVSGEVQSEQRVEGVVLWSATPALRVLVKVPLVRREVAGVGARAGAGDLEVGGTLLLWRQPGIAHGQSLMAQASLQFPTGDHSGDNTDLMVGTGATSARAGLSWFAHRKATRLYVSADYRFSSETASGYQPGDVILANVGVQHPLTRERIDGTFELNGRSARPDTWPYGTRVSDNGGDVVFATPGILANLGPASARWFVRASVQVPVFFSVYGNQRPGPVVQAGLFKSF